MDGLLPRVCFEFYLYQVNKNSLSFFYVQQKEAMSLNMRFYFPLPSYIGLPFLFKLILTSTVSLLFKR